VQHRASSYENKVPNIQTDDCKVVENKQITNVKAILIIIFTN